MERTEEVVRAVITWLPDPEDATIFGGGQGVVGAVAEGQGDGGAAGKFQGGGDAAGKGQGGGGAAGKGQGDGGAAGKAQGDGGTAVKGQGGGGAAGDGEGGGGATAEGQGGVYAVGTGKSRGGASEEGEGGGGMAGEAEVQERYDQYMDLYLHGRPTSSYWDPIWASRPLVLHDRGLVLERAYLSERRPEACYEMDLSNSIKYADCELVDLTVEITDVLNNHPGPVQSFRVDSSCWHDDKVLLEWVKILSEKRIERLIILNLAHAPDLLFPIEELQSPNLTDMSLGFMKIQDLELNLFDYSGLVTLQLLACRFDGRRLPWVITHCPCLENLTIGLSTENLRVISQSLVTVQMWECRASWFVVSSSPKLRLLTLGIAPGKGCTSVSIVIDATPELKKLNGLQLPHHDVTINSTLITKDFISLNSIEELTLGLNMANADHRFALIKILWCMPMLMHLTLRRMDGLALGEGIDMCLDSNFDGLRDTTCAKSQLRYFTIQAFKGGPAELDILRCIIQHTYQLMQVRIECCETCSRQDIDHTVEELRNCPQASEDCSVKILAPNKR